jgi:DNA-directed RNA polymerase specialized sigma24 family protein
LEVYLDSIHKGKLHGETTIGVNFDEVRDRKAAPGQDDGDEAASQIDRGTFRNYRKVESFDAIDSYKACWHLLTHKQQEAVRLYHGEGKSKSEIATLLDKKPNTISGLLKKAKETKEEHDAEMRKQELKLQRELQTKSGEI